MLTWVIVKARIDSSLNSYEHCVACDDENNCCPVPAGQLTPLTLRSTCAVRGVTAPRKAVYSHIVSPKMAGVFLPAQIRPKGKTSVFWRILGVFWLYPGKKARFGPILSYFEAIFGLHLATRGPTSRAALGPKMGPPSEPATYPALFGGCPVL